MLAARAGGQAGGAGACHLVENEMRHVAEADRPLLVEIKQPAGRGNDNARTVGERLPLRPLGHAAVDARDPNAAVRARLLAHARRLHRQLARRCEDEDANAATLARGGDGGEEEGERLARACLSHADNVAAGAHDRPALRLDRRGRLEARAAGEHVVGEAGVGERADGAELVRTIAE